jgi:transposase-like protein
MSGRKTTYSEEKAAMLLKRLEQTADVETTLASFGVTKQTASYWRKHFPEFKAKYVAIREKQPRKAA